MASQFDNRNDFLTRYNYERERRRRASQVQPIPQMMSAHEPVVNPNANINPFQENFTPNTNTLSMQEIAGQVAPQIDQPLSERIARGAMNVPIGMAAMAEQVTSDPAGFAKGTGEYLATWARRLNPNPLSSDALQARAEWGQQFVTDPVGSTLDAAGVAGTALGLPALGGKIKGFKSIKEARAAINDIGKPKVDVPEVVQEPIRSEMPVEQPTSAAEVVGKAQSKLTGKDYEGEAGNRSHITRTEKGIVPIEDVIALKGLSGENRAVQKNYTPESWEQFKQDIAKNGIKDPIFITKDYNGELMISEGNHRILAAKELGLKEVPVEVRYFGKSETQGTLGNPVAKQPTTATEVVAKAKPNLVTGNVKQLTPDELTTAQAKLREKFKPTVEPSTPPVERAALGDKFGEMSKASEQKALSAGVHPNAIKKLSDAMNNDFGTTDLGNILHSSNNNLRVLFTEKTGVSLPKTVSGTKNAIEEWALRTKPELRSRVRAEIEKNYPDKIEAFDAKYGAGKISTENPTAAVQDAGATPAQSTNIIPVSKETEYDAFLKRHEQARADAKIHADAEIARKAEQDAIVKANEAERLARLEASAKITAPKVPKIIADAVTPKKAGETKTPIGGAIEIKDELSTTKIDHKQFKSEINNRLDKMIADAPTLESQGVKIDAGGSHYSRGMRTSDIPLSAGFDFGKYGFSRVSIEIPGDGTFKIWNTKEHLEALKRLTNRSKLPEEDAALRKFSPYNQGLSEQLSRNAAKNAKRKPVPIDANSIELGALGTPSAVSGALKSVGKVAEKSMIPIQYIAKKIDGFMERRGLANPLGTPEIVLKDTGIVEAFRDATAKEHAFVAEQSARLREILGDAIKDNEVLGDMFRHLNDPDARLNPTEQGLRDWFNDMRNSANEFRVKRGEEPIGYIEGYVSHIFNKAKELLDADQSIGLPRNVYNRFANPRVGVAGYDRDLIQALELYTKATARDMYINDALHASIPAIEAMSKKGSKILRREVIATPDGASKTINFYNLNNADMWSKRGYAEAFVRAQLGLPTQGQRFFKQLGINPRTSQKVSNMATGLVYRNLLGMAIDTGIKNLSQITHTIAENGMAPTLRGIGKFLTPEGIKTARAEHLLKEFDAFLLSEDMPAATRAKIFKQFDENVINGAMRFSEFVNRGIAYHTALDDAIKAGKSIADAHEIALKAVRGTQFEYNKLGTSPFMRGPLTRPAAQFMTFPVKTSEMLYRWANEGNTGRGKLLRYFATVGGLVYAGKEVGVELGNIFFDPTKTVDKDSKGGIELPLSGNKVKLDPSRLGTTGFAPQGAVPAVTKPYKYINDLITKDRTAGQRVGQAAREFLPGGRFIGKAVDVATGSEYRDERGRLIRKDSKADAFLKLFGGRSSNQESMNNKKSEVRDIEQEYYETRRKIIDTQLNGDIEGAKRMIADFSEKYPYLASRLRRSLRQGRKDERRKKQMSSDERFMESSIRKQIEHNL